MSVRHRPSCSSTRPASRSRWRHLRGQDVLVFFGYTHCPDVCPETVGRLGVAMAAFGEGVQAVFVTIDPERDTPAWLTTYSQALPPRFTALTGTASQIRSTADAWGVRYARVETDTPGAYSMTHTADVYLVDCERRAARPDPLRDRFGRHDRAAAAGRGGHARLGSDLACRVSLGSAGRGDQGALDARAPAGGGVLIGVGRRSQPGHPQPGRTGRSSR